MSLDRRIFAASVRAAQGRAFQDSLGHICAAQVDIGQIRAEQIRFLPAIGDCHECHGRVLDNEEICRCCGNPVWNFTWLFSD